MKYFSFLALLVLFSSNAAATILFENPWDTTVNQGSPWCSSCLSNYRTFDTFTLSTDATINQIDAELFLADVTTVNYSVWTADRTTELFSQNINIGDLTVIGSGGFDNNFVSAAISGLSLSAGTYALSIWDLANPASTLGWHAALDTVDSSSFQCLDPNDNLNNCVVRTDQTMTIHRTTSVPEPSILVLLGIGLAGIGFVRRKKA